VASVKERYEGLVVRKRFGEGSKSEREAVVLRTGDEELVLRREGGNAFSDPALDELIGRRIRGMGRRAGYTLILTEWEEVASSPSSPSSRGKQR
jgi:hypothetical protein